MSQQLQFNTVEYLEAQGFQIEAAGRDGSAIVVDPATNSRLQFDPKEYIQASGLDPNQVQIEFNNPLNAMPEDSPVSFLDRAKLSFGDQKGKIDFLKGKFEDATYTPKNGLVVKDKGVWKAVDPKGLDLGDPFDLAADILKTGSMVVGGAVGGGAPGGVAGAAAGASASMVLGKFLGTYANESPEEFLQELAWDTALAAVGYAVVPTAKGLGAGVKKLFQTTTPKPEFGAYAQSLSRSFGEKATEMAKSAYASIIATTTNTPEAMVMELVKRPQAINKEVQKYIVRGGGSLDLQMSRRAAQDANKLFVEAVPHLKDAFLNRFQVLESRFIANAGALGKAFKFKPADTAIAMGEQFAGKGLMRGTFGSTGKFQGFRASTPSEVMEALQITRPEANFISGKMRELAKILSPHTMNRGAELTGESAARAALSMKRSLDNLTFKGMRNAPLGEVSRNFLIQATDGAVEQSRKGLVEVLSGAATRASGTVSSNNLAAVRMSYDRMNDFFKTYNSHFKALDNLVRADTKADALLSDLYRNLSRGARATIVEDMLKIDGGKGMGRGATMLRSALDKSVASEFIRIFPKKSSTGGIIDNTLHKAAAMVGVGSPRANVRALAMFDRAQIQTMQYLNQLRTWTKTLPADQKGALMSSNLFPAAVAKTLDTLQSEDAELQQMQQQMMAR